ncbi:MAG: hypothetical protein HQL46_03025 [Gammaproteobacteria bacterium]|nr:hypothetical protein [Gammaproteobacteria bacterium]
MKFQPGFRLSKLDIMVIVIGIVLSFTLYKDLPVASYMIVFVVGHFFLFCNVFRLSRIPELIWAGSFLLLSISTLLFAYLNWLFVGLISLLISTILIYLETKKPDYHGVFWQQLNPELKQWFKENILKAENHE